MAIRSFRCSDTERLFCSETERLFEGRGVARFRSVQRPALRKLAMLHAAVEIGDVAHPAGVLSPGPAAPCWMLRLDDEFDLRFRWLDGGAEDVEITSRN